jgi:uncharacterized protein (TIGR02453 family)
MAFTGFPPEARSFYEGLAADNSKTFWQANKPVYERSVRGPMLALLAELEQPAPGRHDGFGPFHVFRPYQDVRFAKGRPPYKTHIGAISETEGGAINYVQFSFEGMLAGSGYYAMASDQLDRFRRAVDDEHRGPEIERLVAEAEAAGYSIGAIGELKTAPRGYPKDHPRIALIRRKGLIVSKQWPYAKWMQTKAVVTRITDAWLAAGPVNAWLDLHVGPSTLPPPDHGF